MYISLTKANFVINSSRILCKVSITTFQYILIVN
uniref:Uncharacterized protein n=1 Tax=Heterorhabditis bacteriophora TaxID=37862 RepID=A0A1I7X849_HETBA